LLDAWHKPDSHTHSHGANNVESDLVLKEAGALFPVFIKP